MIPFFLSLLLLLCPQLRHSHVHSHSYTQSCANNSGERWGGEEWKFATTSSWMQLERFHTEKKKTLTHKLKNKEVHAPPHNLFLHPGANLAPQCKPRSFLLPLSNCSFYRAWVFSSTGSPVPSGCPLESLGLVPLRIDSLSETLLSRGKRRKS